MSTKYKFTDKRANYFITGTVVGWTDVFTRNIYKNILVDSIKYCQTNQGLQVYAWVIMTNHFHMIASCSGDNDIGMVIKNIKSFTALKLIDAILNNNIESRREWLIPIFEKYGSLNRSNHKYQFWVTENHPVLLDPYTNMYSERLNYLHENPVRAGFVLSPEDWLYSSAIDYYTEKGKGMIEVYRD